MFYFRSDNELSDAERAVLTKNLLGILEVGKVIEREPRDVDPQNLVPKIRKALKQKEIERKQMEENTENIGNFKQLS